MIIVRLLSYYSFDLFGSFMFQSFSSLLAPLRGCYLTLSSVYLAIGSVSLLLELLNTITLTTLSKLFIELISYYYS